MVQNSLAVNELHNNVEQIPFFAHVVNDHNIRMEKCARGLSLQEKVPHGSLFGDLSFGQGLQGKGLDCDGSPDYPVHCQEYLAHSTFAHLANDIVTLDPLYACWLSLTHKTNKSSSFRFRACDRGLRFANMALFAQ